MRPSERLADVLRPVTLETGVNRYAEGSCLVSFGHTKVLVTASLEEGVPGFLRGNLRADKKQVAAIPIVRRDGSENKIECFEQT